MPLIFTCPPAPISCWEYISNKHSTRMNDIYKCTLVPSGNSSLPTTCRPDTVTMSSGPARCSDSISVIGITIFPNFNRIFSCLGRHSWSKVLCPLGLLSGMWNHDTHYSNQFYNVTQDAPLTKATSDAAMFGKYALHHDSSLHAHHHSAHPFHSFHFSQNTMS